LGGNAHGGGYHLTGDLSARGESAEQKIAGTGAGSCASHSFVSFGLIDGAADVDGAGDRSVGLTAFRAESDSRRGGVGAVLVFQRLLERSKVHGSPVYLILVILKAEKAASALPCDPSLCMLASNSIEEAAVPKFVIERDVPGAGNLTDAQLKEISQKSVSVLKGMGPEIQWLHSYVTGDKVYCVYLAPDEATIKEHARRVGLPANRVSAVRRLLDASSAE
jgi:hypothetical protein